MSEAFSTYGFTIMLIVFSIIGYIINKITGS